MSAKHYLDYLIQDWQPSWREASVNVIKTVLTEYGLPWQPDTADIDVMEVEQYYQQTGGEFWVVQDISSQQIIGTGAYYPISRGDKAVEIRKMYLLSAHRGKGLGKYLLRELEQAIKLKQYQEIWLETASVLKEAVRLYETNGYQVTEGVETERCDLVYVKHL
jgi:putative acetyltransferase